jgi:hypothetical protein
MAKLSYTRDELMADHGYAKLHIEAGYRLHGGFGADGAYISPRTLHRWPAVYAWQAQLKRRDAPLIDATVELLRRGPYPTIEQQRFLLASGFGETLWNSLTITGVIEARGGMLAQAVAPDFQDIVVEDISETCLGHLNKGMLAAQGYDEGGNKEKGEGGHDAMWFAVRDEDWILLLMNVLMIEIKAENFFSFCQAVMRDPANFQDRRAAAAHAAELVERVRTDEAIHVAYLTTALSELRSLTIRTAEGGTVPGKVVIDQVWNAMVEWHTVTNSDFARNQSRDNILGRLRSRPNGVVLAAQFDALEFQQAAE